MKFSLKIDSKKIFLSIYILIALANVVIILMLCQFIKNIVYNSIFVDDNFIESQSIKVGNNLSTNKIQNVADQIDAKKERSTLNIKNVF